MGETRATAFVTDPQTTLQWFAIDVDPCTGESSERDLLLVQPDETAPVGMTVFRLGKTDASPVTRQVGFREYCVTNYICVPEKRCSQDTPLGRKRVQRE